MTLLPLKVTKKWGHRNSHLHNNGLTIHSTEMTALNIEIRNEWETGIDQLPHSYNYLFRGQVEHRLTDSINQRIMWITSVWAARDNELHIGPLRVRHPLIITIYKQWKRKHNIE
jgi:hypothetical protein